MFKFVALNWVNIALILVGSFALLVYILQEHNKKKSAAILIVLQIDEIQRKIQNINSFVTRDGLDGTAFYESLPIISTNYWDLYKHFFANRMDASGYSTINDFYEYANEIQAQQDLIKTIQHKGLLKNQEAIIGIESAFLDEDLKKILNQPQIPINIINTAKSIAKDTSVEQERMADKLVEMAEAINNNGNFNYTAFQNIYSKQKIAVETVFSGNYNVLTSYSPIQIQTSLTKILKKYSLLEVKGSSGYIKLKKIARM